MTVLFFNRPQLRNLLCVGVILLQFTSCKQKQAAGDSDVISINGVECGMHGSSKPGKKEYVLNEYKNRYHFPKPEDFVSGVTMDALLAGKGSSDFPIEKAVRVTGYVYDVKVGGVESCNCKTKDLAYRDTHIELTPDAEHTEPRYRLIVEVTPRMRALMGAKGVDWSTEELKHTLRGHRVEVEGWLFFDDEHTSQAVADNPDNDRDWRASCWEVHPVTSIKIID